MVKKQKKKPKKLKVHTKKYRSFRLQKRIKHPKNVKKSAWKIWKHAVAYILSNKRIYVKLGLIALALNLLFVKGFSSQLDVVEINDLFAELFGETGGQVAQSVGTLSLLVSTVSTPATEVAGLYSAILIILMSLAYIWVLRQTYAKKVKLTARQAFYESTYPLIPFLMVLLVIGLQLIPMSIGGFLYSNVIGAGLAITNLEVSIWLVLISVLSLLSLYWVSASMFALYIVTLPKTKPLEALRTAADLVRHRRWQIIRKILFLPLMLAVLLVLIMLPTIIFMPIVAEWVLLILSVLALIATHVYMYHLYRELL